MTVQVLTDPRSKAKLSLSTSEQEGAWPYVPLVEFHVPPVGFRHCAIIHTSLHGSPTIGTVRYHATQMPVYNDNASLVYTLTIAINSTVQQSTSLSCIAVVCSQVFYHQPHDRPTVTAGSQPPTELSFLAVVRGSFYNLRSDVQPATRAVIGSNQRRCR